MFIYFKKNDFVRYWNSVKELIKIKECAPNEIVKIYNIFTESYEEVRTDNGGLIGPNKHLRNGLVDSLGLCGRQRHLALVVKDNILSAEDKCHIFEANTSLSRLLQDKYNFTVSAYWRGDVKPKFFDESVQFQDLCRLDMPNEFFDILVHSDCLEHIPDYELSLKQCVKKLRPGGRLIFSVPIFSMPSTNIRAKLDEAELTHIQEPEWHGDIGGQAPILTFYNFGLDLMDKIEGAGFSKVELAYCHDPILGLYSDNHPEWMWKMAPVSIVATK